MTVFNPPIYVSFLSYLFAALGVLFWFFTYQIKKDQGWLNGFMERTNLKLSKFQFNGSNIEEINSKIAKFEFDYSEKKKIIDDLMNERNLLVSKSEDLRENRIPNLKSKINECEGKTSSIINNSKISSLEEYIKKLEEKNDIIAGLKNIVEDMMDYFDNQYQDKLKLLNKTRIELNKFEKFKNDSIGISYNEEKLEQLSQVKDELINKRDNIRTKIDDILEEFAQIEKEANNILDLEDNYLYCSTSQELKNVKETLKFFIQEHKDLREEILFLEEILNEIANEEKEKISRLLSDQSSVIDYFKKITNGMYTFVKFDTESSRIMVRRKDGVILDADKISGGTYDQLYFCIRLALGEKLLQDEPGFFILDDPFLKSDTSRLTNQLDMLKEISDLGWQIIYFSSKDEVKDLLRQDIQIGNVNYIEFKQILS